MDRARVFDGSDIVVFGLTQWLDSATGQRHDDWYRGQRGWGSDAPYFGVNDPAISTLGPCEYASNAPPPTSFQQNPCHVKNWLYAPNSTILVTEVEEAAADMFLNWVYRTLNITDAVGNMGFANVDWRFANNPPDNTNPGDIRFNWVNEVLPEIFAVQGW